MTLHPWRPGVCLVVCAMVLTACGQADDADEDTGEDAQATAPSSDDAEASAVDGCSDVLEDAEIDGADGQDEVREAMTELSVVDALAAVPALKPIASSLATLAEEVVDEGSEFTLFAPRAPGPDDGTEERSLYSAEEIMSAHVISTGSLDAEALLEAGSAELADGTSLEVTRDEYVNVSREGSEAQLICPDIEVEGGVVHIIDAFLFQPAAEEDSTETSGEQSERDEAERDESERVESERVESEGEESGGAELGTDSVQPGDEGVRPDLREELDEQTPSGESDPGDPGSAQ